MCIYGDRIVVDLSSLPEVLQLLIDDFWQVERTESEPKTQTTRQIDEQVDNVKFRLGFHSDDRLIGLIEYDAKLGPVVVSFSLPISHL